MRIAINGMGRIGRLLFRRLIEDKFIEVVAVNDIMPKENVAYLIKHDSVYGTFEPVLTQTENKFFVNEKEIVALQIEDPLQLPWNDMAIDLVIECSGRFSNKDGSSKHLKAGAKKVLLSTTGADDVPLMVYGFNHNEALSQLDILSPGGCMTNCTTHVLNILKRFEIQSAHIDIIHSYTSRQELVDAPHSQFRRGRAAAESIIPVDIDLFQSLNRLFPDLKNKIGTSSTRIPVANGAMANFYFQLSSEVTAREINELFKKASNAELNTIVEYTEEQIVSIDIKGNTHSCIIDGTQTASIGNHLRLVAWFDNEYGFTSRMIDWMNYLKNGIN